MVVDHADRLHEGIDDGRADELEAARRSSFDILLRQRGLGRHLRWCRGSVLIFGLPSRKSHRNAEKPGPFSIMSR